MRRRLVDSLSTFNVIVLFESIAISAAAAAAVVTWLGLARVNPRRWSVHLFVCHTARFATFANKSPTGVVFKCVNWPAERAAGASRSSGRSTAVYWRHGRRTPRPQSVGDSARRCLRASVTADERRHHRHVHRTGGSKTSERRTSRHTRNQVPDGLKKHHRGLSD